ncbi:protein-tyrosine phosphatase [Mrakia frigida]|uniref:protein-tyrosine phosphatase OCA1 family protein n=1 Tax=Mrakia frigida TaxID=29902 RepID=UPI003FCC2469
MGRLVPPTNFGLVEEGLYRSGQPTEINFPFIEKLQLKAVVWVAPEEPSERFLQFLTSHSIPFHPVCPPSHHHPTFNNHSNNGAGGGGYLDPSNPIDEPTVIAALHLLLKPGNYPCLVMCGLGRHRTGTVVGCLRKLQRWSLSSILEEYRRYAGAKVRILNEQFIELFDIDLISIRPFDQDDHTDADELHGVGTGVGGQHTYTGQSQGVAYR